MSTLIYGRLSGAALRSAFDELASLRMAVFRDFPYLYEGNPDYERAYLETYARSEQSLLFTVHDGTQLVGATTALPLSDEMEEVQAPFRTGGYDLNALFYFGESLLLPAYRGRGLGHRFFDEREAHARRFGQYRAACFCAVDRPADHPLRPADYQPLDGFWRKRGYAPVPTLQSTFYWPDLGATESTPKRMTYWMRPLR